MTIAPATSPRATRAARTATFTATLERGLHPDREGRLDDRRGRLRHRLRAARHRLRDQDGTLTFAPGVTTQTFTVEIIGDTIDEGSTNGTQSATDGETFQLQLSQSSGDLSLDLSDPGTNRVIKILDDDAAPTLVFADKSLKEGNDTQALLTPIMLSNASDHDHHRRRGQRHPGRRPTRPPTARSASTATPTPPAATTTRC